MVLCADFTEARVIKENGASVEEMPTLDPAKKAFLQIVFTSGGSSPCVWCHTWADVPGF